MKRHWPRTILILVLIALLCVAGAELAACSHFAPQAFQRITAPVTQAFRQLGDWSREAGDALVSLGRQLKPKQEESQQLSRPALTPAPETVTADPAITALVRRGKKELITGGAMPVVYFNQTDPDWADQPYGTDSIGTHGCGPTAMAMAVATLTGEAQDPASMARWAYENHCWARGDGSYLNIVSRTAQAFGLTADPLPDPTAESVEDALASGRLLVALMGPGHFTDGGHFILLRGFTLEGKLLVADPNSRELSLTLWDPEDILSQLSHKTENGAPLWVLAPAEG